MINWAEIDPDFLAVAKSYQDRYDGRGSFVDPDKLGEEADTAAAVDAPFGGVAWKQHLSDVLLGVEPAAFCRLLTAALETCGFEDVSISCRPDGKGFDGLGYARVMSLLTERIAIRCVRYTASQFVGPDVVKEFRESAPELARRGLLITTGRFDEAAREEARRGDLPVDLADGSNLADILREHGMGVREVVDYVIDKAYFAAL